MNKQKLNFPAKLYNDLSWLWPMWGSLEDYKAETDAIAGLIRKFAGIEVKTLLDAGCGGGKNLYHFKRHFKTAGLDLSESMLSLSSKINPECEHFLADMRSFDLGCKFDAIYLNDALPHLVSLDDLKRTFDCAFRHLNPGGVMVLIPEFTKENFPNNSIEATRAVPEMQPEGLEIAFIESRHDPDPNDDSFVSTILYLIRENGVLRIERDDWTLGLFSYSDWLRLLKETGFEAIEIKSPECLEGYTVLICRV